MDGAGLPTAIEAAFALTRYRRLSRRGALVGAPQPLEHGPNSGLCGGGHTKRRTSTRLVVKRRQRAQPPKYGPAAARAADRLSSRLLSRHGAPAVLS